jgi:pimeloyl-ACP methyl ester carboxylesterase
VLLGAVPAERSMAQIPATELAASSIGGHRAKSIEVHGIPARYYEAGRGEPLIVLHGGRREVFNSANMWVANLDGLAQRFHVFALDRLGFGLSGARPDGDFRYAAEVQFLDGFIGALGLGRVNIAGNSSGGAVALLYGMAHPDKVNTLAIIAVGPENEFFTKPKGDVMREACGSVDGQAGWECWMNAMTHPQDTFDEEFWAASAHMMATASRREIALRQVAAPTEAPDFWERQREIVRAEGVHGLPILWICGSHDTLDWGAEEEQASLRSCVSFLHTLGANNNRVKTIIYGQAGHFPYREYPELFNHDLASFVDYWNEHR